MHFRKAINRVVEKGRQRIPLCSIDIDQKNFFGSLRWDGIRTEVSKEFPWRAVVANWKHAAPTKVREEGGGSHLSDRGTGQIDVEAPMEACLVQGSIARQARRSVHEAQLQQASTGQDVRDEMRKWLKRWDDWEALPADEQIRRDDAGARQCHKGDEVVEGRLMDQWYLDDGLAFMHPQMAVGFLRAFDSSSNVKGAERNLENQSHNDDEQRRGPGHVAAMAT